MPENPYQPPKEVNDRANRPSKLQWWHGFVGLLIFVATWPWRRPNKGRRVPWLGVGLMCGIVPAFFLLPFASDPTGQTVIISVSLLGGFVFGLFLDIISAPQK